LFKFGEASPVKVIEKYQEGKDYGSYDITGIKQSVNRNNYTKTSKMSNEISARITFHAQLWQMLIEQAGNNSEFSDTFKTVARRKAATKTYFTLPWRGEDILLVASYRKKERIIRLSLLINYDSILENIVPHVSSIEAAIGHKLEFRHKSGRSSEFNWDLTNINESVDKENLLIYV